MGGLTSFASTAMQILGAANSAVGAAKSFREARGDDSYDAARRQNEAVLQNAREQAELQKEQIRIGASQAETERRAALRRAVARQRAQFGASGTGSDGGSAKAVLLGLFDESEEERAQRQTLDTLKTAAAEQGVSQQQRLNTLQLTQLRERNRLGRIGKTLQGLRGIGDSLLS
jgi:hypothetical protein